MLEEIREQFGTTVAAIVDGMTDSYDQENEKWQLRKERYIAHIGEAGASVRLVAVCDKLHNTRSILSDYELVGAEIWKRFRGGKEGSLWYYRALVDAFHRAGEVRLVDELGRSKLLLNFGNVEYLSSAALGKLITLNRKVNQVSGKLILCNIAPPIYEVFEITKLNRVFTIHKDEQAALQSF